MHARIIKYTRKNRVLYEKIGIFHQYVARINLLQQKIKFFLVYLGCISLSHLE
jgi:hypothetical protein